MDFDSVFSAFISWQTVMLCLTIYLISYIVRTIGDNTSDKIKENRYWREIILPLLPIFIGVLLSIIPTPFPWPLNFGDFVFAKIMYSAICGQFSGWVYNRAKSWISSGKETVAQ